jgi:uncharacterized protein (DUF1800 family)
MPTPELTRRTVLQAGAATAVAAGLVTAAGASAEAATAPLAPVALSRDPALHALRRLTYGPTPGLIRTVRRVGVNAWLEAQMSPARIPDRTVDAIIKTRFPHMLLSSAQIRTRRDDDSWQAMRELRGVTIVRAVWSQRQVQEVLHGFWSDHFYTHPTEGAAFWGKFDEDKRLRANTFTSFGRLLNLSASSPAMLSFLNNDESSEDDINENYGRELLELHTVGLAGGYTEADVRNAALAMTGWTYDEKTLAFKYNPKLHYNGALRVLGWRHPNIDGTAGGIETGRSLLKYLASHPATARHISTKLCRRLVADNPPASLVASTTKVFTATKGDVKSLLRHIVRSREFAASVGQKVRRPLEMVTASVRATGGSYDGREGQKGANDLLWRTYEMGHAPFEWIDPDGYPDTAQAWLSSVGVLGRWNTSLAIAGNWFGGIDMADAKTLAGGKDRPAKAGPLVDALTVAITGQKFARAHRNAIIEYLGASESTIFDDDSLRWRGPRVISLILASPYMQVR